MKYAEPAGHRVHGRYSLSAGGGDVRGHRVFTVHNHGEGLAVVGLLEGRLTAHQHEEDDPQTPDVCTETQRLTETHQSAAQMPFSAQWDGHRYKKQGQSLPNVRWSVNHVQEEPYPRIQSGSGRIC